MNEDDKKNSQTADNMDTVTDDKMDQKADDKTESDKKSTRDYEKVKTGISDYLISYDCPFEYLGFQILCDLVYTALLNYTEFTMNLKSVYYTVGAKRKMTRLSLERNLLTLVEHWEGRPKFRELFTEVPTNAKMLHILTRKLRYLNCSVYDTLLIP